MTVKDPMDEAPEILIVDDEPIVLKRLKTALEKSGYAVQTCENGEAAFGHLERQRFDVVVTDIRMDGIDGIQVLDRVRASSSETITIMITGQ